MAALAEALARAPVASVEEAVDVMQRLDSALPPEDGVRAFNHLYLRVTLAVDESLRASARAWRDPEFIRRLDVVFANLYFSALRAAQASVRSAPSAWRALFEARRREGIAKIQFAVAGMNAHINRDLVAALAEVCDERGLVPTRGSKQHQDYTDVNALLEAVEDKVKADFSTGLVGVADQVLGRLDDVLAMWSVSAAREAAWNHAEVYCALPDLGHIRRSFLDTLDRSVGFAGRGLVIPVGVP